MVRSEQSENLEQKGNQLEALALHAHQQSTTCADLTALYEQFGNTANAEVAYDQAIERGQQALDRYEHAIQAFERSLETW